MTRGLGNSAYSHFKCSYRASVHAEPSQIVHSDTNAREGECPGLTQSHSAFCRCGSAHGDPRPPSARPDSHSSARLCPAFSHLSGASGSDGTRLMILGFSDDHRPADGADCSSLHVRRPFGLPYCPLWSIPSQCRSPLGTVGATSGSVEHVDPGRKRGCGSPPRRAC